MEKVLTNRYIYSLSCHHDIKYETFIKPDDFQAPLCSACGHSMKITTVAKVEVERPSYADTI